VVAALGDPSKAAQAWESFRTEIPVALYPSELAWAGGYIYFNLKAVDLRDSYLRNIYRYNYLANNYKLAQVTPFLKELTTKTKVTPIKSFGISDSTYSIGQRPIGDFDFYVDSKDLHIVKKQLKLMGFHPLMGITEDIFHFQIRDSRGSWNYVNGNEVDLDLHWKLFDHLTDLENSQLVFQNSTMDVGKYGEYRRLNLELSAVLLGIHHNLNSPVHWGNLFDFISLIRKVNRDKFLRIIDQTETTLVIQNLVEHTEGILGSDIFSFPRNFRAEVDGLLKYVQSLLRRIIFHLRTQVETVLNKSRFFHLTKRPFRQADLHTNLFLYLIWEFFGSFACAERLLNKFGYGFTKHSDELIVASDQNFLLGGEIKLGFGWHFRYPNQTYRLARYPDTRIIVKGSTGKLIKIELDSDAWKYFSTNYINVFAGGIFMGSINKPENSIVFRIPESRSQSVEISMRRHPYDVRKVGGLNLHSSLFLAPVKQIEVIAT